LLVNIGVYIPENLNKEEKASMEKLGKSDNVKPNASAARNFFTHFRNMFE